MNDAINSGLTEKEADVVKSGSADREALLAVPNNVPLIWGQSLVRELNQRGGDVRVGDPAGDDERLLLLHVQHIWAHLLRFQKWLLAVCDININ